MEGPGVRAIADRLAPLAGRKIISIEGKSRFPLSRLVDRKVSRVYPTGKLLLASPSAML